MEEKDEVFNLEKVQEAVKSTVGLFEDRELTRAESCKVVKLLDVMFKAKYPDVYRFMNGK